MPEQIQIPPVRSAKSVRLLGSDILLVWKVAEDGLSIIVPQSIRQSPPCDHAWAFEITDALIRAESVMRQYFTLPAQRLDGGQKR